MSAYAGFLPATESGAAGLSYLTSFASRVVGDLGGAGDPGLGGSPVYGGTGQTPQRAPHTLAGTDGDDTFSIDRTNFAGTTILAATIGASLQNDVIRFGEGITAGDLHFARNGSDLQITLQAPSYFSPIFSHLDGVLTVRDFFLTTSGIDTLVFADGTTLSASDVWHQAVPASLVTDTIRTDDGGQREIALDGAQTEPWTSVVAQFDAAGVLQTRTAFLDDGSVDTAVSGSAGHVVTGGSGNDKLTGGDGNDTLQGLAGNDTLQGGAGDDVLDGGTGADTMAGGSGSDAYLVDNLGDAITEQPNEGADAVFVSVSGYVLADNVENGVIAVAHGLALTGNDLDNILQGNAGTDGLDGAAGNDWLMGEGGNDALAGGSGNDILDGGSGIDTMAGGIGNDAYLVDNLSDVVIEQPNEGADAVFVSVSGFVLPDNVENGVIAVTNGLTLSGNALDNGLEGNIGNDVLTGGGGDDTFVFKAGFGHDTVTDLQAGIGPGDTIMLSGFDDVTSFADVLSHATQQGTDVLIDFGQGDQLLLRDVVLASLADDDFKFV